MWLLLPQSIWSTKHFPFHFIHDPWRYSFTPFPLLFCPRYLSVSGAFRQPVDPPSSSIYRSDFSWVTSHPNRSSGRARRRSPARCRSVSGQRPSLSPLSRAQTVRCRVVWDKATAAGDADTLKRRHGLPTAELVGMCLSCIMVCLRLHADTEWMWCLF